MKTHVIKFYCPHCDQTLKCEAQHAGRQIECPACHQLVRIPPPPSDSGLTQLEPKACRDWDTANWGG